MKTLITLLMAVALIIGCNAQEKSPCKENYYMVYVHENNMNAMQSELTVKWGELVWDKQEAKDGLERWKEKIRNMPPVWASGMEHQEFIFDGVGGEYAFTISNGSYYKILREETEMYFFSKKIDVKGVLYSQKMLIVWFENGEVKCSFDGIRAESDRDLFLLYSLKFTIIKGKLHTVDVEDLRGFIMNSL